MINQLGTSSNSGDRECWKPIYDGPNGIRLIPGSNITLTLKQAQSETIGTYPYSLTGVASGGANVTVSGSVQVLSSCGSDQISLKTTSERSDLTTISGIPRLVLKPQAPVEGQEFDVTS